MHEAHTAIKTVKITKLSDLDVADQVQSRYSHHAISSSRVCNSETIIYQFHWLQESIWQCSQRITV